MAKPSKSQNPEFLAKRRKAIAELAKRRRQQGRAAGPTLGRETKLASRVSFAASPTLQN